MHIFLVIGSVSMFDFGIGRVGSRKERGVLGHFDLRLHIERAGRVRLHIKEVTTHPAVLFLCL